VKSSLCVYFARPLFPMINRHPIPLLPAAYECVRAPLVVGVGINLDNAEPTTCVNRVIAERLARDGLPLPSTPVTRERLLAAFMNRFEALHGLLASSGGFAPLEEAYLRQWLHTDQEVSLEEDGGVTDVRLTVKGLTSTGYLLAVDGKGARYELHPDGNSLDFFKGLVRKKVP